MRQRCSENILMSDPDGKDVEDDVVSNSDQSIMA